MVGFKQCWSTSWRHHFILSPPHSSKSGWNLITVYKNKSIQRGGLIVVLRYFESNPFKMEKEQQNSHSSKLFFHDLSTFYRGIFQASVVVATLGLKREGYKKD
ncbi:hypothetical protein KIL84_010961 [Mauremys mutica]|uniref:Uncharacterized protein n=1 Tax=Mauremys mutica TaxID=74926 RepID=A0A9D3XB37_9SAUR|nr:hypothetical protein KIL84_010961 [Mauremys mutica]